MKTITLKNSMKLIIREAQIKDTQQILDYLNKIAAESDFLTFGEGELTISLSDQMEFIKNCLDINNKLFLVGEIDGEIVANLNFQGGIRPRISHVGEFGVTVLKDYWGYGIGKEMIIFLTDWAKENGLIKKINLRVREDNERGIKLYEDLGFYKEGFRTREFYIEGNYYGALYMGLKID